MLRYTISVAGLGYALGSASSSLRGSSVQDEPRYLTIDESTLQDKLDGFWIGQLVGNFMGLPFEFLYNWDPMPLLPNKYYDQASAAADGLKCNVDGRGSIPEILNELQGAYTDDDTDIEYVTLYAVEEHGLGINYTSIADYWKKYVHIQIDGNDALWFANKRARELMDTGMLPPATGSKENNYFWWTIDPQLVNELWSAFYPGMLEKAVERAEWGAKITSADWGTHPTMFYAALYSGAFFVDDVQQLYDISLRFLPKDSPFRVALEEVRMLYRNEPEDWRKTWYIVREKYWRYPDDCGGVPWNCGVSAMINGVMGALAFLYGNGDYRRTVGLAIAAGFDCDNQAATLAGLLGVMHGLSAIPREWTHAIAGNNWTKPYNDKYVNLRRPPLPRNNTNSEIVSKIKAITTDAIVANGGTVAVPSDGSGLRYTVQVSDALLQPWTPFPTPAPTISPAPTPAPSTEGCCKDCSANKPFCSDVSGNCYGFMRKDYYRTCAMRDCCTSCSGKSFCSPVSGTCYESKSKKYYLECDTSR